MAPLRGHFLSVQLIAVNDHRVPVVVTMVFDDHDLLVMTMAPAFVAATVRLDDDALRARGRYRQNKADSRKCCNSQNNISHS